MSNVTHLSYRDDEDGLDTARIEFVREAAKKAGDPLLMAVAQAWALTPVASDAESWRWSPVCHHALAAAARILGRKAP